MDELSYFQYTTLNRQGLAESNECACIYCFKKYSPKLIYQYCYDYDQDRNYITDTANCYYCSVDAVVPNSLIKYTDQDLERWHEKGFGEIIPGDEVLKYIADNRK